MLCKETWAKHEVSAREEARADWTVGVDGQSGNLACAIARKVRSSLGIPRGEEDVMGARISRALSGNERVANIAAVVAVRFAGGEPPPALDLPEWQEEAVARVATAVIKACLLGDKPSKARVSPADRRGNREALAREAARAKAEEDALARYAKAGVEPPHGGVSPTRVIKRAK